MVTPKIQTYKKVFDGCSQCCKIFSIITQPCKIKHYGATSNLTKNIIDYYNNLTGSPIGNRPSLSYLHP